jgi:hypothetical protein
MNHEGHLTSPPPEPAPGGSPQPEPTPGGSPQPAPTPGPSTAPAAAPSRSWFARYARVVLPAAGVLAVGAITVAAVLLLAKPNPSIEKMVPAGADFMAIADLNPSLAQKVNLMRAVHSFPDTSTDAAVASKLDEGFKDIGMSYTSDVQPWLDGEVGLSGTINFEKSADGPFAFFATSRDDAKAKAALAKFRSGIVGKKYSWRDESYNGFKIAVGTPTVISEKPAAYSYVDHVVVIATSDSLIREIIDADQGRTPRLVDSNDYKATLALLPSDRVGMAYFSGKSLVSGVKQQMSKTSMLGLPALKTMDDFNALRGIGGTLSATTTGVVFDIAVKLDASKLSVGTRQAFSAAGSPDAVLRWIPKSSDGFLAIASVDRSIKTLLDQYGSDPSVQAGADAVGLTGPQGILPHLTGDLGLEVELGNNSTPTGALLLGTNDPVAMNAFLGKLMALAAQSDPVGPGAAITRTTYRGTVVTSLANASWSQLAGFAPSYAALDGMGILASSPAEVKAVIDAHRSGSNITADPTYQIANAPSLPRPAGMMYVNLARVADAAEKLHVQSSGYLSPLTALMLTASGHAGDALERFFVVIK